MSADTLARGLAAQARATGSANAATIAGHTTAIAGNGSAIATNTSAIAANTTAIASHTAAIAGATTAIAQVPRPQFGNSIVAMGDSNTANAAAYSLIPGGTQSWQPKGIFAQLIALSGGALQPPSVGYPATAALGTGKIYKIIVVNGGAGYSPATTLSFDTASGGSGAAATPIITGGVITGGVITGVTITNAGNGGYAQQPRVTVGDSGGGTGAILAAVLTGIGAFATGGMNSEEIEGFVPDVIASGARNALVMTGTNDQYSGMSFARSQAAIARIAQRLLAGGVRPIFVTPPNRMQTASASGKRYVYSLSRWIVNRLPVLAPGTIVVNPLPYLTDGATDEWPAGYLEPSDGTHTTPAGAYAVAKLIWQQIGALFPQTGAPLISPSYDQYDATLNPDGNLLSTAQALMRNNSTAAADAPWSGTKMAGLALQRIGGSGTGTIAASVDLQTSPRRGYCQTLTVSVTGETPGAVYRVLWTADGTHATLNVQGANTLQLGDIVQAVLDQASFSNMAGVRGVKFYLAALNGNLLSSATLLATAGWGYYEDLNGNGAQYADTLRLPTRELVIPANTYALALYCDIVAGAAACSFTARLFGASVRRLN